MARQKINTLTPLPVSNPDKTSRVERERARIMDLFAGADPNKLDFIRDAVQQVSWLGVTIVELQEDIDKNGPTLPYNNGGNQKGMQANPACRLLKDFQTIYTSLLRNLLAVLPNKGPGTGKLEALLQELDDE